MGRGLFGTDLQNSPLAGLSRNAVNPDTVQAFDLMEQQQSLANSTSKTAETAAAAADVSKTASKIGLVGQGISLGAQALDPSGTSPAISAASGAASGAATGAMLGGGAPGAVIGGVIGGAAGLFGGMGRSDEARRQAEAKAAAIMGQQIQESGRDLQNSNPIGQSHFSNRRGLRL